MGRLLAPSILGPAVIASLLLVLGLVGAIGAGWGYGLFLATLLLLGGAVACGALLLLTRLFDTDALRASLGTLALFAAWSYLFAVVALAGHYTHETFAGRMETRWILFGPAVVAALVVLDVGLYRLLVMGNMPAWNRYRVHLRRELVEPEAIRRALIDDVILHRSLFHVSAFRWFKHTLIFWGFVLMFATELGAVMVREAWPAFGFADVWEVRTHPLRLAFDFVYDFTGLMVLVGCVLALVWRIRINGTEEQRFSDTPTAVFLLFVVVSGFAVEAMRLAAESHAGEVASFVGYPLSFLVPAGAGPGSDGYELLWLIHVLGSCAFIAYVPLKRLVHSCATPMGRLMLSQQRIFAEKKRASLSGLMAAGGWSGAASRPTGTANR